jgi:hypothetical protein
MEPSLLEKALPALAAELCALLQKAGEDDLAMQVPQLLHRGVVPKWNTG